MTRLRARQALGAITIPLSVAEYYWRIGHWSDDEWEAYMYVWTWSAPRFSGTPGRKQDEYAAKFGMEALERRRNRLIKLFKVKVITPSEEQYQ